MKVSFNRSVPNTNKAENNKHKVKTYVKSTAAAALAAGAAQAVSIGTATAGLTEIQKIGGKLTKEEKSLMNKAADAVLKQTGLAEKGVQISHVTYKVANTSKLPDQIFYSFNPYASIAEGRSAGFILDNLYDCDGNLLHKANSILVNREKLPNTIFHETGHAINRFISKTGSFLQNIRYPAEKLGGFALAYAILSDKSEAKDGKELNALQKTNNFIRKNAGILAFMGMLPKFAEETMASVRGTKFARANLPAEVAKKVGKTNMLSSIGYLTAAVATGLGAHFAVKIKDSISEKKSD